MGRAAEGSRGATLGPVLVELAPRLPATCCLPHPTPVHPALRVAAWPAWGLCPGACDGLQDGRAQAWGPQSPYPPLHLPFIRFPFMGFQNGTESIFFWISALQVALFLHRTHSLRNRNCQEGRILTLIDYNTITCHRLYHFNVLLHPGKPCAPFALCGGLWLPPRGHLW